MVLSNYLRASLLSAAALTADAACVKPTPGNGTNTTSDHIAATYFAGFHIDDGFPVSSISWDRYTDIKYSFAETTPNNSLDVSKSAPDQIPVFVSAAKENGVKALVSIGGWTGSRWFSTSFGSPENRTVFAKACMDLVSQYQLDGLDFDYEYPNRQGLGCNAIGDNDTANYLAFLQELRQQPGAADLTITAAGSLLPWNDATGAASTDLSAFADVLDYVMIMNYDIYGPWASTAGPNAPLRSACDSRNNQGSGELGINAWLAAGMPADKIVMGIAAYGHGFRVNATAAVDANDTSALNMYPGFNASDRFQGSSWDNDPPTDDCGNPQPHGGTYQFWSLVTEAQFLDESGNPREGIQYGYDECSQTPAVYNATSQIWVSYDNAQSVAAKGQYILDTGLKGFAVWEAGGDYNNILADSIRKSMGMS